MRKFLKLDTPSSTALFVTEKKRMYRITHTHERPQKGTYDAATHRYHHSFPPPPLSLNKCVRTVFSGEREREEDEEEEEDHIAEFGFLRILLN